MSIGVPKHLCEGKYSIQRNRILYSKVSEVILQNLTLPQINLNLQQPALLQYCADKDIVVMGYTPFGSLFYNKAKPDAPPPRIDDPALVEIAAKYRKTVPQIALRYLVRYDDDQVII